MTHICISKQTIIGSDNGLSPARRQAIISTNAEILLIGPSGTNFSEILIEIHTFPFTKMHLNISSGKQRPFCLGLNVFRPSEWVIIINIDSCNGLGWVGLWGFLWWAPSAKRKDHHGVSSGWSNVWHCSNTGLSSSQYEQISIILGVWPFCLTPFFFRSITFWRAYG